MPNVLIVQTDARETELVMELIRDVVRAQIDSTNSGERAIDLVSRTQYHLVIADCGVGGVDGLTMLERIKRVSPTTSVILTSSFASIEEAVKAVRSGAEEYFKKPFNMESFKLSVRRCLDSRALYTGDQNVSGLMLLLNACQLISGFLEEDKILETVTGYLKRETAPKGLALFRVGTDAKSRIRTASEVDGEVVEVLADGHNFIQACHDEKVPMKLVPRSASTPDVAVFQFRCSGETEYFIVCIAPNWPTSPEEVLSRFRLLQAQIQMTGRNIHNYRGVRHLLYLDEPTGLHNTRYLHLCLDQRFERRDKSGSGETFSVLFIDVDKFKKINDSYGHVIGTRLLHEMGQLIKSHLRKTDVAFRYGGDEFVVLLDGCSGEMACQLAEKLRSAVEEHVFLTHETKGIKLTISAGVANCPEHALTKREIIEAADAAMYSVKRSSRNNVYIAEKKAA